MNRTVQRVAAAVLKAAADTPHFFDWSDAERMSWCIVEGYLRGQLAAARSAHRRRLREARDDGREEERP